MIKDYVTKKHFDVTKKHFDKTIKEILKLIKQGQVETKNNSGVIKKNQVEIEKHSEILSRLAALAIENKEENKEIKEQLKSLDHLKNIPSILDKMANDFYIYRQQQELSHGHMSELWVKIEENQYQIKNHETRISHLEKVMASDDS